MRHKQLAELLRRRQFMDADDAATFLGIEKVSLEAAAIRRRIPFVQMGSKKLFGLEDLKDYKAKAARGRESGLRYVEPEVIERLDEKEAEALA